MRKEAFIIKVIRGLVKCLLAVFSMIVVGMLLFNRYVSWLYVVIVMVWGYVWLVKQMNWWLKTRVFGKEAMKK